MDNKSLQNVRGNARDSSDSGSYRDLPQQSIILKKVIIQQQSLYPILLQLTSKLFIQFYEYVRNIVPTFKEILKKTFQIYCIYSSSGNGILKLNHSKLLAFIKLSQEKNKVFSTFPHLCFYFHNTCHAEGLSVETKTE